MKLTAEMTLEDIAFAVCTCLDLNGITAVLTGGSAATVHAPNTCQSRDLDFIIEFSGQYRRGEAALQALGFELCQNTYRSNATPFTIDFPAGPLAVGDELIDKWETRNRNEMVLRLITATDSVRDRLAWYYFANDYTALATAIGVASANGVDLDLIRTWSAKENSLEKFEVFLRRLERA